MTQKHLSKRLIFTATSIILALGLFFTVRQLSCSPIPKVTPIDPSVTAPAVQLGKAFVTVADHVRPAVVSVFSEKIVKFKGGDFIFPFGDDFFRQFFGEQIPDSEQPRFKQREHSIPVRGMGSGTILDNNGHILTNYHVVSNVDKIKVQLASGATFSAKIKQIDPNTDIAVIQLDGKFPKDLPAVTFGDSDVLRPGELVIAVGAPFGLPQTITQGIISATGRSNVGIEAYEDFIQTDAPINPGNSGGPLVNMNGEVIGINTAIATSGSAQFSGVGFAVPSNLIKTMLPKLLKGEKIRRGKLGIVIQDLTDDLAKQFDLKENDGVLVSEVQEDSAAQKAGIKSGDVIVKYGDKNVTNSSELRNLVSSTAPGNEVKIKVLRNKKELTVTAKVDVETGESPPVPVSNEKTENFLNQIGISVRDINRSLAESLKIKNGVVVTEVEYGSPAAFAGILPYDVIIEANRNEVKNTKDLQNILNKSKNQNSVLFLIKRQNVSLFIAIQLR